MSSTVQNININHTRKIYIDLTTQEENEIFEYDNHPFWTTLNEQTLNFEPDSTLLLKNIDGWRIINPVHNLNPHIYGWEYIKGERRVLLVVNPEYKEAFLYSPYEPNIDIFLRDYHGLRSEAFNCNEIRQLI